MSDAAQPGHRTTYPSSYPGMTATGKAAIVRECLGKSHADTRTDRGSDPYQKRVPAFVSGESCGEYWRECRNRSIHQTGQTRLHDLQDEQAPASLLFIRLNFRSQFFLPQRLRTTLMTPFFLGEIVEQLTDTGILTASGGFLIKAPGFNLHGAGGLTNGIKT